MKYRFSNEEVRAMTENIIAHIENEQREKNAWRLRLVLEGMAYCCHTSKKEKQNRLRMLALYETLTRNDILINQIGTNNLKK